MVVLGGAGAAGLYWVSVLTGRGQRVENRALESSDFAGQWRGLLDLVSIPAVLLALTVAVAIALLLRNPRGALRAVIIVGASNVVGQALKYGFLTRPDFAELGAANTFPSGHAVAFASVVFAFIVISPPRLRLLITTLGVAVVGVASAQLLGYGWHRMSDVAGGVLIVTALVGLSGLVVPPAMGLAPWRLPLAARVIAVLLLAALFVTATGLTGLAAIRRDEHEPVLLLCAMQATALFTVLLCAWLVAAVSARPSASAVPVYRRPHR